MKILADEDVERPIIVGLRLEGYDVISIAEKADIVVEVIKLHQERLFGSFTIITTRKVRITKRPPQSRPKRI